MTAHVATFIAFLTNCLFIGEQMVEVSNDGSVRGLIRLTLDGFQVQLRQAPWVIRDQWSKHRSQWKETTHAQVLDVPAPLASPDASGVPAAGEHPGPYSTRMRSRRFASYVSLWHTSHAPSWAIR
jgi:hypothetical protein